jgi:hypothetical protein
MAKQVTWHECCEVTGDDFGTGSQTGDSEFRDSVEDIAQIVLPGMHIGRCGSSAAAEIEASCREAACSIGLFDN